MATRKKMSDDTATVLNTPSLLTALLWAVMAVLLATIAGTAADEAVIRRVLSAAFCGGAMGICAAELWLRYRWHALLALLHLEHSAKKGNLEVRVNDHKGDEDG